MVQLKAMKELGNLLVYRWRYALGYGALAILFIISVTIAGLYAPGGLTQVEINTIERTNQLASGDFSVVNLPLHLLQLASFSLFGVSIFSIKLPAIIMSVVAGAAIFFLLRRWFKSNVAILSMLIMTATGQFIFLAQNATSHIFYVAFSALILLFASLILQKAKGHLVWKIGLAISVALSCYTPYFIYVNLGLLIAALFHPHPRHHILRRSQRLNWLIAGGVFALFLAPLIYLCINSPELFRVILGHEALQLDVISNIHILLQSYFWIEPIVLNNRIAPAVDFSALALMVLGFIVLFRHRYTARSYIIVAWLLITLPIIVLRPHLTSIVIVPLFILLAIGVETLLSEWYRLFPKNPYARTAGLIMIVGLIGVMVLSGVDRFSNGYRYFPDSVSRFNTDLSLVRSELAKRPAKTHLIASEDERPLYEAFARHGRHELVVGSEGESYETANIIVTREANQSARQDSWQLQRIVTNDRAEESDRLYLYKAN